MESIWIGVGKAVDRVRTGYGQSSCRKRKALGLVLLPLSRTALEEPALRLRGVRAADGARRWGGGRALRLKAASRGHGALLAQRVGSTQDQTRQNTRAGHSSHATSTDYDDVTESVCFCLCARVCGGVLRPLALSWRHSKQPPPPPQSEPHPEAPRREPPLVKRGRRPALTFGGGVGGDDLSLWQS